MDKSTVIEGIRVMLFNLLYETAWMSNDEVFYWYVEDLKQYGIICDDVIKMNGVMYLHFTPDGTRAAEGYEYKTSVRYQEHTFDVYAKNGLFEPEDILVVTVK